MIAVALAACTSDRPVTKTGDRDDNGEIKEHRDQWHPNEAQSDFLDIGKQAGIEWLSFVPQDQQEYPEYFTGLDRDQKRRLRLAPKGSDTQVLLEFKLAPDDKLWPVDWFGTELIAVDHWESPSGQLSVAIAETTLSSAEAVDALIAARAESVDAKTSIESVGGSLTEPVKMLRVSGKPFYYYGAHLIEGRTTSLLAVAEMVWPSQQRFADEGPSENPGSSLETVLNSISFRREIALEGSPKHKCTSTLNEQLAGTLRFSGGTLTLPVQEGHLVRKIGGDSTIQIDGEGAEPWLLLRRMKAPDEDIRAVVRRESTLKRRRETPSAKFSAGFTPEGAKLPMVVWEYGDTGAENELVGVFKAGGEWFVFEVVSTGLRDGDKRRAAKAAALTLLAGATADGESTAPEFDKLIGWNASE